MTEADKAMLSSIVVGKMHIKLDFVDIRPYLTEYSEAFYVDGVTHISAGAYYRFFIPKIFSGIYDKALYLDCDLVVLDDVAQLFDYDLGDNLLAASHDYGFMFSRTIGQSVMKKLGLAQPQNYFNSGVLLFNIKQFEKEDTFAALFSCLRRVKTPICHDQDILNIVCEGRVFFLSEAWNCKQHIIDNMIILKDKLAPELYDDALAASKKPSILHYTTANKPWNRAEAGSHDELFWKFARKTPCYETIDSYHLECKKIAPPRKKPSRLSLWKYTLMASLCSGARREHYEHKIKRLQQQGKTTENDL